MQGFQIFWAQYPKRVAKKDAEKAWKKLNPSPELVERIMAALDWQTREWIDPKFIPYPASWIRAERWDDERPSLKAVAVQLSPWVCEHEQPCAHPAMCRHKDAMPHKYPKKSAVPA